MLDALLGLLEAHGYPIVLLAAFLESLFVVGMFVPGQAIILVAGLASPFTGLSPVGVAVAAAAGEVMGNFASLAIGRFGGPRLFPKIEGWLERRGVRLERVFELANRQGGLALLVGRPAWGFKNVLPAVVGAAGMSLWRAMGFIVIASVLYYPALVALAYGMGFGVQRAAEVAAWIGVAVAAVLAAGIGILLWSWRRRMGGR